MSRTKWSATRKHWWIWVPIVLASLFGSYKFYRHEVFERLPLNTSRRALAQSVVTARVRKGDLPIYLQGLGTVTASRQVTIRARIDGELIAVNFKEGSFVHEGELLARIDPHPYQIALEHAQSTVAEAEGTLKRDDAIFREANLNLLRDRQLFASNLIAKQLLDTQKAASDQDRAILAADEGTIQSDEAAVESAKLNLSFTKITAPISRRIGFALVDAGNIVLSADKNGLAVITQVQPISVLFTIPEEQLPLILKALQKQPTETAAYAYEATLGKELAQGTVVTVDNRIDTTTGTAKVEADFLNSDLALFPNEFVNVRVLVDVKHGVTLAPAAAIQQGPGGTFVYVAKRAGLVRARHVTVNSTDGANTIIESGLVPGDQVIVAGTDKLTDGMKVTVSNAIAPRHLTQPAIGG